MDTLLARFGLEGLLWQAAVAGSIFGPSLFLAVIFNRLLYPVILRFTRWTPTNLDTRLVAAARLPLTLAIVVFGGYLALTVSFDLSAGQQRVLNTVASLSGIILGVVTVASAVSNAFSWYLETVAPRTRSSLDDRLLPLLRRVAIVLIYALGALLVLDHLNVNITPLIAGMGLGGLAVALALQPTLANIFAGTYVMTEGVITAGDYIELENGVSGYVVDVSWRSTRLRTWGNNLVVIPNSKFAETIITNFQEPIPAVNVYLTCGVSYDSDLYQVERVCHEVMAELLETDSNAVKEYGGWFGFDSFADSNVNFWLFVQAKDRLASYMLQSSLMQKLHQRLREEGIVINYPVRTLQFPKEWEPDRLASQASAAVTPGGTSRSQQRQAQRGRPRREVRPEEGEKIEGGIDRPGGEGPDL